MEHNEDIIQANLPISMIDPNPDNDKVFSMDDINLLAQAIKENGFRGSIEVYQKKDGRYEIIAGHRRTEAAKEAGLEYIPAMIYPMPESEIKKRKLMVDSNIYNREFSPLDWANAINYHRETIILQQKNMPSLKIKHELTKHFGMSSSMIYNYLSILDMIPEVRQLYAEKKLPIAMASQLSTLSEELQKKALEEFNKLLSVQQEDDDGKKRIATTQATHIINKIKADDEREKHRREPVLRVEDQFYASVNPSPTFDYSEINTKKTEAPVKNQSTFFNKVMSDSPFDKPINAPVYQPIVLEERISNNENLEKEVPKQDTYIIPIDRTINQMAIQLQRLTNSSIKVEKKEDVRASIDMVKRAIETIEKEL